MDMAMVALNPDPKLSIQAIAAELAKRWPDLPPATELEQKDGTLGLTLGSHFTVMGIMPAPLPWSDLQPLCDASWLWKDAAKNLKRHTSHLVITLMGEAEGEDRVANVRLLTQITAAVMASCPQAVGVLWVPANMVVQSSVFVKMATELSERPYYLWVNFQIGKAANGLSGYTNGMRSLGFMDFEVENCPEPKKELHDRLVGLVHYLLDKGAVIRSGDTVGETADERIRVVYADSVFGQQEQVMRLEYGTASNSSKNLGRRSKQRPANTVDEEDDWEADEPAGLSIAAKIYLGCVAVALAITLMTLGLMFFDPAGGQAKGRPLMLGISSAISVILIGTLGWMMKKQRLTVIATILQALALCLTCLGIPIAIFGIILLSQGGGQKPR